MFDEVQKFLTRLVALPIKHLFILLLLLAVAYSTAPAWVDQGVSLNYTVGSDSYSYTVLSRTTDQIFLKLQISSSHGPTTPIENATRDLGNFWFDPSLLSNTIYGQIEDGFTYVSEAQQAFAGQTFDAITVQEKIQGLPINRVYDKATGLFLQQTANGQPTVTLTQQYIPAFAPAASPPQPTPSPAPTSSPTPSPTPALTPTPVSAPTSQPTNNTTSAPSQNTSPSPRSTSPSPSSGSGSSSTPFNTQPSSSLPCCPSAFILLIVTFVVFKNKN